MEFKTIKEIGEIYKKVDLNELTQAVKRLKRLKEFKLFHSLKIATFLLVSAAAVKLRVKHSNELIKKEFGEQFFEEFAKFVKVFQSKPGYLKLIVSVFGLEKSKKVLK